MNAAFGGGAFAGDHAIAHNGEGKGCGIAAGNLRRFEGADWLGDLKHGGRHCTLLLGFFFWSSISMRA
jgi:hypothetical protein